LNGERDNGMKERMIEFSIIVNRQRVDKDGHTDRLELKINKKEKN
jgi:hypothetical protein